MWFMYNFNDIEKGQELKLRYEILLYG